MDLLAGSRIFVLTLITTITWSSGVTPLPTGFGALIYDYHCAGSPAGHCSIQAGQWAPDISSFNSGATNVNKITRLYPYASDIEITCTEPQDPKTCTIAAVIQDSINSYATTFPTAIMMPIMDISFNYSNNSLLKTDANVADVVANLLAAQLCSNVNIDGVLFDIETSNAISSPGLLEFYRQMSVLFASSTNNCVNAQHPKGRYLAIYHLPVTNDWSLAQQIFAGRNNGYYAIPLYDVKGFSSPPSPDPLSSTYNSAVTSAASSAQNNSASYQVPYTFIVPAGASFGTFQNYGVYDPGTNSYQVVQDFSSSNTPQLGFVQNVRTVACQNNNAYYMGMDYWSWQQYVYDAGTDPSYPLRGPNVPDAATVTYLQTTASCS